MMGQATFEARHAAAWQAFESWLAARERLRRARRGETPVAALPDDEVPAAYRALCQHLALARDRQYSPDLVDRLNQLVLRGHHALYGARGSSGAEAIDFFLRGFPRLVRDEWRLVLAACLLFFAPMVLVFVGLQAYPDADFYPLDPDAEAGLDWVRAFVLGIRQIRGEMDIPPARRVPLLLQGATAADRQLAGEHGRLLCELAKLSGIEHLDDDATPPPAAVALLGKMKLLVPLAGLIDVTAERERLQKNRQKAAADLERVQRKLATESFVANAPAAVVEKERERLAALERDVASLGEQLARLATL